MRCFPQKQGMKAMKVAQPRQWLPTGEKVDVTWSEVRRPVETAGLGSQTRQTDKLRR